MKDLEKKIGNTGISGKKFEDLSEEEMNRIQGAGSGDVQGEDLSIWIALTLSRAPIKCR